MATAKKVFRSTGGLRGAEKEDRREGLDDALDVVAETDHAAAVALVAEAEGVGEPGGELTADHPALLSVSAKSLKPLAIAPASLNPLTIAATDILLPCR